MELTADRITKQYKNKIAVDRMSFTLGNGVRGLLGSNGAGKTTLMRLLCGILTPTSGTVTCGGMKQRLGIAQALLNDPQVLIMDEPTAGLDPQERIRFRELISGLGRDRIVLLSTHIVSDLEHIADRLMIMKEGRLLWRGEWDGKENLEEVYISIINGERSCLYFWRSLLFSMSRRQSGKVQENWKAGSLPAPFSRRWSRQ